MSEMESFDYDTTADETGVSVDGYPTYENKRWDFVEMFGVKKK